MSYEFFERNPGLDASDRSFTDDAPGPISLLPEKKRHSLFFSGSQEITETIQVFADGLYSEREALTSGSFVGNNGLVNTLFSDIDAEQYGVVFGAKLSFANDWSGEFSGTYGENKSDIREENLIGTSSSTRYIAPRESTNLTVDALANGSVFNTKGGEAKLAIGAQYREEDFTTVRLSSNTVIDQSRYISAVFGELFIPLVSEANRRPGVELLELSLAVRQEDYNDFGTTTDPKVGMAWSPIKSLILRSTYGTSFRAPLFFELQETNTQAFTLYIPDPIAPDFTGVIDPFSPAGGVLAVIPLGGNADLKPEEATTFTAGFDFQPASIPGLEASMTYFDIEFTDRITQVSAFLDGLTNPDFVPLVTRNPDPALLTYLTSLPLSTGLNLAGADPATATVLVDNRLLNLSESRISGIDFDVSYALGNDMGLWDFSVSGTYLIERESQILSTSDFVDQINTVSNPVDLKLRSGVSWQHDSFAANMFINYVDSYKDDRVDPNADISSWITVDLNLGYTVEDHDSGFLNDTVFSLVITNLFDRDPPFVTSFLSGRELNFDSDNASPVGRFLALQVTKKW